MSPGWAGEIAVAIEATGNRKFTALAVEDLEFAIGELTHRHVEEQRAVGARNGDGERVVADRDVGRAPRRHQWNRVRPTNPDTARVGGLEAVGAGPHPVIRVAQTDAPEAVLAGEFDGAAHGDVGIPEPDAHLAVPLFERPETADAGGFGVGIETAAFQQRDESRKAVEAVGKYAVPLVLGEEPCHQCRPRLRHAMARQDMVQLANQVWKGDAWHGASEPRNP
jgi:hypothetical protein